MPTTEPVCRLDTHRLITPENTESNSRVVDGQFRISDHLELNLERSPYRAYITHTSSHKTSLVLVREGIEQAAIIVDEDLDITISRPKSGNTVRKDKEGNF